MLERAEVALLGAVEDADGRLLACRIELGGITTVHGSLVRDRERLDSELRGLATDLGRRADLGRADRLADRARRARRRSATTRSARRSRSCGAPRRPRTLAALADGLRPLAMKLPPEVKAGPDGFDPTDPETLARLWQTSSGRCRACWSSGARHEPENRALRAARFRAVHRDHARAAGRAQAATFTSSAAPTRSASPPPNVGSATSSSASHRAAPTTRSTTTSTCASPRCWSTSTAAGTSSSAARARARRCSAPTASRSTTAVLDSMLGGMTREVFESMFSITHESLVVGGKALLAADGNVGEILFSASLGATGLHELRAELEREAGALFRPRATSSLAPPGRAAFDAAQTRAARDDAARHHLHRARARAAVHARAACGAGRADPRGAHRTERTRADAAGDPVARRAHAGPAGARLTRRRAGVAAGRSETGGCSRCSARRAIARPPRKCGRAWWSSSAGSPS